MCWILDVLIHVHGNVIYLDLVQAEKCGKIHNLVRCLFVYLLLEACVKIFNNGNVVVV